MLQRYNDLLAKVRGNDKYHPIRELVQPDDPDVKAVAEVLMKSKDFIGACQDFVTSFTTYKREIGDYWATPAETMLPRCSVCGSTELVSLDGTDEKYSCKCGWEGKPTRSGDCDDKAILLVSLLRNQLPPDSVYCAIGIHRDGHAEGHMWVIVGGNGDDRIIEATAGSDSAIRGNYDVMAFFNDAYTFAYPEGLREFNLEPVEEEIYA